MQRASQDVLDGLRALDSATVFNAVVEAIGGTQGGTELKGKGGQPESYTGPEIRCMLPQLGSAVGYVVTSEVTTNDPDSVPIPWDDYYELLNETPSPIIAVMKDVDSRPGRGAAFGDGMAALHKAVGVTGVVLEGSTRDLKGIEEVGLPIWATGMVPGHGVNNLVRINSSITVGQLRVHRGDLLVADYQGCTKIPKEHDPADILRKAREIWAAEQEFHAVLKRPDFDPAKWREILNR